jgi:N-methylhydantoinase A
MKEVHGKLSEGVRYRFAFDIGGTFTDLVLGGSNGSLFTCKCLTRHDEFAAPIVSGLRRMLTEHDISSEQVDLVIAGASTAVTNLIIERKGAPTGLIATEGFRDVIEIGRELRYDMYDLSASFPEPLVPPELRAELPERIDSRGTVLREPSVAEIEAAVDKLRRAGAQAIAVALLHSYRNPEHEKRVGDVIRRMAPELFVSLSSEVLAEIREYERTVATVLNAYVMPMMGNYLATIESGLKAMGIDATLQVMQSNGGIISREFGERMPIRMLESGPAAGALGAVNAARKAGYKDVLAFDMGGTTAKACLISDEEPDITTEFEAARKHRFKRGSGYPVRLPTVDLIEIGAGGGSIAYIDTTGLLKVGPRSAGAAPGPACYGLGGSEPTVTDAALVLGHLDPDRPLSGEVRLQLKLAERAITSKIADRLGMSMMEAACGIYRIVCEQMAAASKVHAVDKGRDLRRYALLAFGGAGPIHARDVAHRIGCREIIVPANAGVFSAQGLLVSPLKLDLVRTRYGRLEAIDWPEIRAMFIDMEDMLRQELLSSGVATNAVQYRRSADIRYVGQGFEVATELAGTLGASPAHDVAARFHAAYERQFGHHLRDQPIEVLNWRIQAVAPAKMPELTEIGNVSKSLGRRRSRSVFFPSPGRFHETQVIDQADLAGRHWQNGPALIEQDGSTAVVGPSDTFVMDDAGNIRILIGGFRGSDDGLSS